MKILICGSMSFYDNFKRIKEQLETLGNEVTIPLSDEAYSQEKKIKETAMKDFNNNLEELEAINVNVLNGDLSKI